MIINDALRSLNRFKDFDPVTSRVVIVTRRPGPKSDTLIRFSCTVLTTVSEMTYTVSSGKLNSSIPYRRNGALKMTDMKLQDMKLQGTILSSIWAPAARSVALISRWWCVFITDNTEHCSSHNGRNCFTVTVNYYCDFVWDFDIFLVRVAFATMNCF